MIRYDASIIREFAQSLYNQAESTVLIYTIGGIVIGVGLGYLISTVALLIGAVIIGGIGYMIGQARAFQLKLQAQVALCQVQIEENTRQLQITPSSKPQANPIGVSQPAKPQAQRNADLQYGTPVSEEQLPSKSTRSQIEVIKRFSDLAENAMIDDNQKPDQSIDQAATLKVVRTEGESAESSESIHSFRCPWCSQSYEVNTNGGNVVFRCIKCQKQILIAIS